MSENIYHNHHIIPKYRCKELGIDPDFPENIIRLTRLEHAQVHYDRWLTRGRVEDLSAAKLLAEGEIDGIDTSGKNHPMWGKTNKGSHDYWIGRKHTDETRKKMSVSRNCRLPDSAETRKKKSEAMKGKVFSEEHKKNMSEAQKGRVAWNKGKVHSEETKKKMSEAQKGRSSPTKGKKRVNGKYVII